MQLVKSGREEICSSKGQEGKRYADSKVRKRRDMCSSKGQEEKRYIVVKVRMGRDVIFHGVGWGVRMGKAV
jgi:hypothetical protein